MERPTTKAQRRASDPNTALRSLARLATKYPEEVSANPGLLVSLAAGEDFAGLLTDEHAKALLSYGRDPNLFTYLLDNLDRFGHRRTLAEAALLNPHLPAAALHQIEHYHHQQPDWHLSGAWTRHRNNPIPWQGDPTELLKTRFHARVPQGYALLGVYDLPKWVQSALQHNPAMRNQLRHWRPTTPPAEGPVSNSAYPTCSYKRALHALDQHPDSMIIAMAMRDQNDMVRLAAAHNHHAPRHLLEEMLDAADLAVAQAAQHTLEQATPT